MDSVRLMIPEGALNADGLCTIVPRGALEIETGISDRAHFLSVVLTVLIGNSFLVPLDFLLVALLDSGCFLCVDVVSWCECKYLLSLAI